MISLQDTKPEASIFALTMLGRICSVYSVWVYVLLVATPASAELVVPVSVECGRVGRNQMLEFQFEVKNSGSKTAEIIEVLSSCACTNLKLEGPKLLAPKEACTVRGKITFGRRIGRMQVNLHIRVNDSLGMQRTVAIPLYAEVIAPLVLEKEQLHFADLTVSDNAVTSIVKALPGNDGLVFNGLVGVSEDPWLKAEAQIAQDGSVSVKVVLDPMVAPLGYLRSSVRLQLTRDGKSLGLEEKIDVTGRIRGPIEAKPASIYVGSLTKGEKRERTLKFSSPQGLDLRKTTFEAKGDGLSIVSHKVSPSGVDIEVRVTAGESLGTIEGRLVVKHPEMSKVFDIPVLGLIKGE